MQLSTKIIRGENQQEYWSKRANTYGHQYGLDRESVQLKIQRKVSLLRKYINFNGKVIEMGCGTGLYTKEFSKLSHNFVATDISTDMVEVSKKYCPNVEFLKVDARHTGIPNNSYDVVVSSFLLQHVDIKLVVPEMYRILKSNGKFGAFVPNILNPLHYSRARVGFMRQILKENSESEDFNRWEWVEILNSYGFKDIKVIPIEFTSPYLPSHLIPFPVHP